MASIELDDVPGPLGEGSLQPRRRSPVLRADEVGRWDLLPGRRSDRLGGDLHALPRQPRRRLRLDVRVAVLQERLHKQLGADAERARLEVDVEKRCRGAAVVAELGQALPHLGQVAGHQHQVAHRVDAGGRVGGHNAAVAVRDHDGRLRGARQHATDSRDVLGQPGTARTPGCPRLPAAGEGRRHAGDAIHLQQLGRAVPPPRPVLHARPVHEDHSHRHSLALCGFPLSTVDVPIVT